jgi:hypothetical protein
MVGSLLPSNDLDCSFLITWAASPSNLNNMVGPSSKLLSLLLQYHGDGFLDKAEAEANRGSDLL